MNSLVHAVAHLSQGKLTAYKVAWNLLVGVPTLTPSTFFSTAHRDHHTQKTFGTREDPEYITNVCRPGNLSSLSRYILLVLLFPLLVFLRFVLFPFTFLTKRTRNWTLTRLSTFSMNTKYHRDSSRVNTNVFLIIEFLCFLRAALILVVVFFGLVHWTRIPLFYSLALGAFALNELRLFGDHHFDSDGRVIDFEEHISDSCNYSGGILTWILFPFSIKYHALHHIFPSMPYHNLAAADQYLINNLPHDSNYHLLQQKGWWATVSKLIGRG